MHTRAIFSNARKKRARKKVINIYEAFFCLTLNGLSYLEQRRDSIEVTLRGLSQSVWRQFVFEMACLHWEEKGKSF